MHVALMYKYKNKSNRKVKHVDKKACSYVNLVVKYLLKLKYNVLSNQVKKVNIMYVTQID